MQGGKHAWGGKKIVRGFRPKRKYWQGDRQNSTIPLPQNVFHLMMGGSITCSSHYLFLIGGSFLPRIMSAAFSAIIMTGAHVFPVVTSGIILASTTRIPSRPCTLEVKQDKMMVNSKFNVKFPYIQIRDIIHSFVAFIHHIQ